MRGNYFSNEINRNPNKYFNERNLFFLKENKVNHHVNDCDDNRSSCVINRIPKYLFGDCGPRIYL
jgi:hypothetical protein